MVEWCSRETVAGESQWAATRADALSLFQVGEKARGLVKFR
jgi:hypothetical protein